MDPDRLNDNAADDTDVREQEGHQIIEAEIASLERKLIDIDAALVKIGSGNYGYDEKTGEEIPLARLELIPEARFTVEVDNKMHSG